MDNYFTPEELAERDTLLLEAIQAEVPNSTLLATIIDFFAKPEDDEESETMTKITTMLKGYGTVLNIIQSAIELDGEGDLYTRLSAAYYELTNKDPGAETDEFRLNDEDDDG